MEIPPAKAISIPIPLLYQIQFLTFPTDQQKVKIIFFKIIANEQSSKSIKVKKMLGILEMPPAKAISLAIAVLNQIL